MAVRTFETYAHILKALNHVKGTRHARGGPVCTCVRLISVRLFAGVLVLILDRNTACLSTVHSEPRQEYCLSLCADPRQEYCLSLNGSQGLERSWEAIKGKVDLGGSHVPLS